MFDKELFWIESRFWQKAKIAEQEFVYANRKFFGIKKLICFEMRLSVMLAELFYAPKREGF